MDELVLVLLKVRKSFGRSGTVRWVDVEHAVRVVRGPIHQINIIARPRLQADVAAHDRVVILEL